MNELLELKKWIEEQLEVGERGLAIARQNNDLEAKLMYASENTTWRVAIMKIEKMMADKELKP